MSKNNCNTRVYKYKNGNPRPIPKEIKDYFMVDTIQGELIAIKTYKGCRFDVGDSVGVLNSGYKIISFKGSPYRLHRVMYYIRHNEQPEIVDHINGDRLDNRMCNLRSATTNQNTHNSKLQDNNRYGCKGIAYRLNRKTYRAGIEVNGKKIYLGAHKKLEDAIQARKQAEIKYQKEFKYKGV